MSFGPVISPEKARKNASSIRFIDARGGDANLAAGHLPGAVHADLERDLSGDRSDPAHGGRHPLPDLRTWCARLGAWGIDPQTPVVVYDDKNGVNAASRVWWMLRAVGHRDVAVLDGGLQAALTAGFALTTDAPAIVAKSPYPANVWHSSTITIDDVAERSQNPSWVVIDVREGARFRGETEPLDPVAGHIPGAVNVFFRENLDVDGRFKSAEVLRSQYENVLGGVPANQVVVQCGSGVTACHTLVALERAGLFGASLYVGSWSEWCRSGRPTGRGPG